MDLEAADTLSAGDTVDRHGTTRTVKRVSIARSGNVEVDYEDGTIEDLDPSSYMVISRA
jgi:hypothetical protein